MLLLLLLFPCLHPLSAFPSPLLCSTFSLCPKRNKKSKMPSDSATVPSSSSATGYELEFRSPVDDAWYSVRTVLDGKKLTVKYHNFSEDDDNVFEPHSFKSLEQLYDFKDRFRQVSAQLQDDQCNKVAQGDVVCASHSFPNEDVRFYDAVVDDVIKKDHSFAKGEEECLCTFVVVWQHGPIVGCLANKKIENLCLVQSNDHIDPMVAFFLKIVKEKLQNASHTPPLLHSNTPIMKPKLTYAQRLTQGTRCARRTSPSQETKSSNRNERIKEDIDIGGHGNYFVLLIENLDKDLSPLTIKEFIHRQTSISLHAYVFPSLLSEAFTRGALVLNCQKNFEKVCEFLDSPNGFIVSTRGRPWVVTEKLSGNDMLMVPTGNLMLKYQNKLQHRSNGIINNLKVVCSGSEEYKTAKRLRDLFVEFAEHQKRLHNRLAMEEREIWPQARVV